MKSLRKAGRNLNHLLFLGIAIFWLFPQSAYALSRADLTFYVPFENSLVASFARGNPAPTGKRDSKSYRFVDGVRGKGVIPGQQIEYQMPGNINLGEGTFSIWIKPVGWQSGNGKNHYFVRFFFDNLYVLLYQFYSGQTGIVFQQRGKTVFACRAWITFKRDKFYQLVFTYKPGEMSFYVDGILRAHRTEGVVPFHGGQVFRLASGETVFDEMLIFNRALTPTEVKALYQRDAVYKR